MNPKLTFSRFVWRFSTGNFLDGKRRDNPNQQTWWSRKSRLKRAMWRWTIVLIIVSIHPAYKYSPVIHVRLAVFLAGEFAPLIVWQASVFIVQRIQPVKMVVVTQAPVGQQTIADYGEASEVIAVQTPKELDDGIEELSDISIPVEDFSRITRPRNRRA